MKSRNIFGLLVSVSAILLEGCGSSPEPVASPPPPVTVMLPVEREVTDYEEFTGRAEATETVNVRARVSGYLEQVLFQEGKEVKKDEVLYIIDQGLFQAEVDRAKGDLDRSMAAVKTTQADLERQDILLNKGGTSRQDYDLAVGKALGAKGEERVALANLKRANINLKYTTIKAAIAGRIGRSEITVGNLVNADNTLLTTIVSQEPLFVYFNMDERTLQRIKELIRTGKVKAVDETKVEARLALATDIGYPRKGFLNFIDNKVNPSTGTLKIRVRVENPMDPRSKLRPMSPGMFVRIHLPIGDPHKELMVPERAIGTDMGQKVLYLVNAKNEVLARPVTLGLLENGMRVIRRTRLSPKYDKEGREILDAEGRPVLEEAVVFKSTDRVIIDGLQRVRPGMIVQPKKPDDK